MPKVDLSKVPDQEGFASIPTGEYRAVIETIYERQSNKGDEMWGVLWRIIEGDYVGRGVFDNLTFSEKAMWRVKLVCSRLDIDVSGEIDLIPSMLHGKQCFISVIPSKKPNGDPSNNITKFRSLNEKEKVDDDLPY